MYYSFVANVEGKNFVYFYDLFIHIFFLREKTKKVYYIIFIYFFIKITHKSIHNISCNKRIVKKYKKGREKNVKILSR